MKNAKKVASLLLYVAESTLSSEAYTVLSDDDYTLAQKHIKFVIDCVPNAHDDLEGARMVAAVSVAYPDDASSFMELLIKRPRESLVGSAEKPNEQLFRSVVAGVFMALGSQEIHFGTSRELFEMKASDLLAYMLTEVANHTKSYGDTAIHGTLTNDIAEYFRPKEYVPGRTEGLNNLLQKLGEAGTQKLYGPGPFAIRVLDSIRHTALGNLNPFLSILALSKIFRDGSVRAIKDS